MLTHLPLSFCRSLSFCLPYILCSVSLLPVPPTVTVSPDKPVIASGNDVQLNCSGTTSAYYVVWYKNGALIYGEDLTVPYILMQPPQGITVDSSYTMMISTLTIELSEFSDSGSYTCAVSCRARGVQFGMIPANLQDTSDVRVYGKSKYDYSIPSVASEFGKEHTTFICLCPSLGHPAPPNGLSAVIKLDDTSPVTANISWMALMDNVTGIPPGENQTLRYLVEVSTSTSAVLFNATVDHPTNTVEAPNLPACENLTVSVTAENLFFNGASVSEYFMTVEQGW